MPITPKIVIAEARSWIGTPYRHQASLKGVGCDCLGLVRGVWRALQKIPYGTTINYGTLAQRIGKPTASRAVGAANGRNPISIVIPCHRVIGSNGTLTGYGGGLPNKQKLLALERGQIRLVG